MLMDKRLSLLAINLLLLSSCTTTAERHPDACTSFLDQVPTETEAAHIGFDLEQDYGITRGNFEQAVATSSESPRLL